MIVHWLCIRMPRLPLEIFTRSEHGQGHALVVAEARQRAVVLLCNQTAYDAGIHAGMPVSSARALIGNLVVLLRDDRAERHALRRLAGWLYQFSSQVSLRPPCTLLLEIQGSQELFGGRAALLDRIYSGLATLGYQVHSAGAPTPLAAYSLACCGSDRQVGSVDELPAALAPLPLSVLDWEQKLLDRLEGMGIRRLGELFRLPRDGLARRLGPDSVKYLDRMLGRCLDPLKLYRPPARFNSRLQLPAEVGQASALLFALRPLLLELTGWLQGMSAGVQRLDFMLWHRQGRQTGFTLGVYEPGRDLQQFTLLLRERLERLELQEPVVEVGLRTDRLRETGLQTADWFGKIEGGNPNALLDRLRARLGDEAVCGLTSVAEHRPEYAWSYSREPGSGGERHGATRPLWLLPVPRQLQTRNGRPCLQGLLSLELGRERIESGWWDEQDVARDYFVASNPGGSCFWVYREIGAARRWFLHGIFE